MKIDWKQKLSSRKFWALLAALIISILSFFSFSDSDVGKVSALITAVGSVCVYTLAETSVDKKRIEESFYVTEEEEE